MSERKSGLFLNKKGPSAGPPPAAPVVSALTKGKNVPRRWLYVGGGIAAAVMLFVTLFGQDSAPNTPRAPKNDAASAMISVTPPNADKAAFEANFGKELERLRQDQERLKEELEKKNATIEKLANSPTNVPPGIVPPPMPGPALAPLAPPVAPPSAPPPVPPSVGAPPPIVPTSPAPGFTPSSGEPLSFDAPQRTSSAPATVGAPGAGSVQANRTFERNSNAGLLVPGAFAPVALLNGLDAGTSTTTQSNPQPVLMRISDHATLPGSARYQLRSCFVLGSGYGELSSERVNIRFSRLSCVDRRNRLVLSQEVSGYLVDSDGKLGMRGVIVDRQGAKLGKAMLAGFAEGLARALGAAQSAVTTNALGESSSVIGGSAALRAAGLSGAESATKQLAQFYLDEAKAIFPVITVDAGRTGTIVFTSGVSLNWSDGETRFVEQVTPR